MENSDYESLSSAFSRCVAQLGRTVRSYIVEPTSPPPKVMASPYRNSKGKEPVNRSIPGPSEPNVESSRGINMVNCDDDVRDDQSVVTVIQHVEPRPMTELSSQDVESLPRTVTEREVTSPTKAKALPTSTFRLYQDKLRELLCKFVAQEDAVSPYNTSLASWASNASEEDLLQVLEWRLLDMTELFRYQFPCTKHHSLMFAQTFIHVEERYVNSSLALATIGGMSLLLRTSHLSRSPDEMMEYMQCDASHLNHQLFECLNRVHIAKYVLIGDPPDGLERDVYYKICVSITARALYGVAYVIHGAAGVKRLDQWLQCSHCYASVTQEKFVTSIADS